MRFHPRTAAFWRIFILGFLFFLWFGLIGLSIIAQGNLEAFLQETFRHTSRRDAFVDLNRVSVLFWVVHSFLTMTAFAAARSRRSDVFAVLLIGPALGLVISLFQQRWADPNWAVFVGVCLIGWLAGTMAGGSYWFMTPNHHRREAGGFESRSQV